ALPLGTQLFFLSLSLQPMPFQAFLLFLDRSLLRRHVDDLVTGKGHQLDEARADGLGTVGAVEPYVVLFLVSFVPVAFPAATTTELLFLGFIAHGITSRLSN